MSVITEKSVSGDWIDFRRDVETGIESINAHFRGTPTTVMITKNCFWA